MSSKMTTIYSYKFSDLFFSRLTIEIFGFSEILKDTLVLNFRLQVEQILNSYFQKQKKKIILGRFEDIF